MRPAIEFEQQGSELLLRYSPRDDDSWVHDRFERGDNLVIKRTFHLRQEHLVTDNPTDLSDDEGFYESEPLRFKVATGGGGGGAGGPGGGPGGGPRRGHH